MAYRISLLSDICTHFNLGQPYVKLSQSGTFIQNGLQVPYQFDEVVSFVNQMQLFKNGGVIWG